MTIVVPDSLIERYSVAVPRYTSYPTAVEFAPFESNDAWNRLVLDSVGRSGNPLLSPSTSPLITKPTGSTAESVTHPCSIYVHVPFCHSLCYFCACHKEIPKDRTLVTPLLEGLEKELKFYQSLGWNKPIAQFHIGGGTPNYLSADEISHLFNLISDFGKFTTEAELACELDPRTVTADQLTALKKAGLNRASLGVQDFDPHVQQLINRIQPYEQTRDLVLALRDLGIGQINFDLIYGLPDQTSQGFNRTLDQVLTLKPSRIALYGYAHVTWIKKAQKSFERSHLPTPKERIGLFLQGLDRLTEAGYQWIGFDHFALPDDPLVLAARSGTLRRNFMGYTTNKGLEIVGLGPSAISSMFGGFGQNEKETVSYLKRVSGADHRPSNAVYRGIEISEEDRIRGELIECLLCNGRLSLDALTSKYRERSSRILNSIKGELEDFQKQSLIELRLEGNRLESVTEVTFTPLGRLFMRNVAVLFDTYLKARQQEARPVFSQAL